MHCKGYCKMAGAQVRTENMYFIHRIICRLYQSYYPDRSFMARFLLNFLMRKTERTHEVHVFRGKMRGLVSR